jgi:hypothetical protein
MKRNRNALVLPMTLKNHHQEFHHKTQPRGGDRNYYQEYHQQYIDECEENDIETDDFSDK